MKNFLQNLLILFALCLCGLIAFQWVRETDLRRRVQALTDSVHDKLEAIQKLQATIHSDQVEIQRLDGLKNQLTDMVKSNQLDIARLTKDLDKVTTENDKNLKQLEIYKDALQKANNNVLAANERIKQQSDEIKILAQQHTLLVTNLNEITSSINEVAKRWSSLGEDFQKASPAAQRDLAITNLNAMSKDFNGLASKWNQMLVDLQKAGTNRPSNP